MSHINSTRNHEDSVSFNDVEDKILHSRVLLHADDLKLFHSIRKQENCEQLQRDLNSLVAWSERNHLPFNFNKCEKITYTRNTLRIFAFTYRMKNEILNQKS